MSAIYVVTGLPRCRSAWLANLLTWGGSFCLHDGFRDVDSFDEFVQKVEGLQSRGYKTVGISDPACSLFWRRLHMAFPTARWLVVQRPFEEALAASRRVFPEVNRTAFDQFNYNLQRLVRDLRPMVVDFDAIDRAVCYAIDHYLNVGIGPVERIDQLLRLNVQVEQRQLRRDIDGLLDAPPAWLQELDINNEAWVENPAYANATPIKWANSPAAFVPINTGPPPNEPLNAA